MKPPQQIDGADVLEWAWSDTPFGEVSGTKVHGLAVCRYAGSSEIYRFSCDAQWNTEQDEVYGSVQEAIDELPHQYRNSEAIWRVA